MLTGTSGRNNAYVVRGKRGYLFTVKPLAAPVVRLFPVISPLLQQKSVKIAADDNKCFYLDLRVRLLSV